MNIRIIAVGKLKKSYIKEGVCDFCKRLSKYANIEIVEVKDEKTGEKMSKADEVTVISKEGERILSALKEKSLVICLDVEGKSLSSEEFAQLLASKKLIGVKELSFVIGGYMGLSEAVLNRAFFRLSLSKMTFPHEMAQLMLLEQLYRAERINTGHTYHR